ncbi:hypothetical protein MMPV_003109 [Pyropia vietnamensis]
MAAAVMASSSRRPQFQPQVDATRWVVIYPAYLNANYSFAQGRKIPKSAAVADPTITDVFEAARGLGVSLGVEDKCYPRDFFNRGRIRVQLWNTRVSPKVPVHPHLRSRRDLYVAVAAAIPAVREARAAAAPTVAAKAPVAADGSAGGASGGGGE